MGGESRSRGLWEGGPRRGARQVCESAVMERVNEGVSRCSREAAEGHEERTGWRRDAQ